MSLFQKIFNGVILGVVIILLFLVASPAPTLAPKVGVVYEQVLGYFYAGINIGPTGSNILNVIDGTCALIAPSYTVAASTTVPMDCAVTGSVSGDKVFANFNSTAANGNGWLITGASASTTANFITFRVTNFTGGSALIPATIASSTPYLIIR